MFIFGFWDFSHLVWVLDLGQACGRIKRYFTLIWTHSVGQGLDVDGLSLWYLIVSGFLANLQSKIIRGVSC